MPELPEVEVVVRQLQPLVGLTVGSCQQHKVLRQASLIEKNFFKNHGIKSIKRVAKYILISFDNAEQTLLIHLGMTGVIRIVQAAGFVPASIKHLVFWMDFNDGQVFYFTDFRGFGQIKLLNKLELTKFLAGLAPDANSREMTVELLIAKLKRSANLPIKTFLLDQKKIAGIGNIYACEALFLSKIHPKARAGTISNSRAEDLLKFIKQVLNQSIELGGSSVQNYYHPSGESGSYHQNLWVYGRAKKDCLEKNCNDTVEVIKIAARSTYFCPGCQQQSI